MVSQEAYNLFAKINLTSFPLLIALKLSIYSNNIQTPLHDSRLNHFKLIICNHFLLRKMVILYV